MLRLDRIVLYKIVLFFVETLFVTLFLSDFVDGTWSFHFWNTAVACGLVYLISRNKKFHPKFNVITFLVIWFLSVSRQALIWGVKTFPLDDPQLVILTLQMPLDGFTFVFIKSFFLKVVLSSLLTSFFISILIETWVESLVKRKSFIASAFVFVAVVNVLAIYDSIPVCMYKYYLLDEKLILEESNFFRTNYVNVDTVKIQGNEEKTKNLILIIMESIENSFVDSASGGNQSINLMPELLPADSNEIHFSKNQFIGGGFNTEGASITISATVAKTTGVPLLLQRNYSDTLLEKVSSIYDILKINDYYNVFIQGTDANFSGTKNYVLAHGMNTLYDMHSLKKMQDIDNKYRNFRTFEAGTTDRTILDISKHILDTLSKKKHFSLTIATIETHFPYGFYNKNCEDKPKDMSEKASLEATIRCASKDVRSFINWVKSQPFYPNVEIVIVGDHLFMGDYLVEKDMNKRKWYDLFINPAVMPQNIEREFSSVDIAPTILESLGFYIDNHKMGFGASLFSDEKTLVEKIGINALNREFVKMKKSIEYNEISYPANKSRSN